jgi:hypothetical protein
VGQREVARKQCNLITVVKWQGRVTALGIPLLTDRRWKWGREKSRSIARERTQHFSPANSQQKEKGKEEK